MSKSKPISTSLLLLIFFTISSISSTTPQNADTPAADDLEELLALDREIDEQEEQETHNKGGPTPPSESEILRRAQKLVIELSNDNARRVVEGNPFVLLLGYAPWCPRSAELMPRFAEAAMDLKGMDGDRVVVVAKLDAERHTKAAEQLGVRGFPSLLLFVNGSSILYSGGFSREEIVMWTRKKTGYPVIRLTSHAMAEEFCSKHDIYLLGLFEDFKGPDYDEFLKAATADNEIQFVEASNLDVAEVLFPNIKPQKQFLGLAKNEPERFIKFEETFEEAKILHFIQYNKFPLVTTLTELNSARVYSTPIKLQVYVFAENDDLKSLLDPIRDVARKYKEKIMFVHVDPTEDSLAKPFLTLYGLEPEKPLVTAFDNRVGSKHLLESDLTPNNLEEFCSGLLGGNLSPYYKSEPIPETKEVVQKIVGRTFDALVLDSSDNIFLEVYTPWCIDCEATSKQVAKLAKHFKGMENLIFARIDASANEHPKLQIDNYPTLLFYPSGDKSNPVKVSKKSGLKDMAKFIKTKLKPGAEKNASTEKDEL
ncbi:Protein disulfide isomerase-like 1-5 [Acorus calamus]|uniref:protein disulfide-isomerase n=1 Tax=Acorus calamus TaxID=4465 RepID=A0AAV9CLY0_ACOCL|nr:Protein disulfide isomerase-like 1-5 [Acorus calamus]